MQSDIESVPVFLLLKKLFKENLTGKLLVKYDNNIKTLFLKKGYLMSAKSNIFDDRIGVILYLLGKFDREQYDFISGLIHSPENEVVKILISNNLVSKDELNDARSYQKRSIALSTFSILKGIWQFTEDEVLPQDEFNYPIPLSGILYQGGRDEAVINFFRRRFYFHCPMPLKIPKNLKHLFTEGEMKLLKILDKSKNFSNVEIIDKFDMGQTKFWQTISVFWLFDILEFENKKVDQKIKTDFNELMVLKQKIEDKSPDPQESADEAGLEELFGQAKGFYQKKQYDQASLLLKKLAQQAPQHADLNYYLALSLSNLEYFKNEAEKHFKKAIELEPWNPEPSYALGIFFKDNKRLRLAEKCFRRTLVLNPNYVNAEKALKDINSSSKKRKKSLFKK